MKYVPRDLAATLRRASTTFPAILVTGARQTGKTTLLRHEFGDSHRYVSLERPDVRARVAADPVAFLQENPPPLILDEIQNTPDLLHYVKDAIDRDRSPGRWLLTGSQSFPVMQGVGQTLAGRIAVLNLDPLSVGEARDRPEPPDLDGLLDRIFTDSAPAPEGEPDRVDLADWLLRGGFPEPRLDPRVDRQLWFSSYVQTYLQRDVRDLAQVGDLGSFQRFLALVASRTGQLLNMAELGRETGVSAPTVRRWLSVLETSRVVSLLPAFHRNLGKRIRKSPKLYLLDPGLATWFLGLHTREAVLNGPSLGPLVETAVVTEWLKACRHRGEMPALSFWQSTTTAEVDLIIERGGRLYGLEVKATATPTPEHARGLAAWLRLAGPEARAALACHIDRPRTLRPGIRAVPWHLGWV